MLTRSSVSFSMNNAPLSVKLKSSFVTDSNIQNGIYNSVTKYYELKKIEIFKQKNIMKIFKIMRFYKNPNKVGVLKEISLSLTFLFVLIFGIFFSSSSNLIVGEENGFIAVIIGVFLIVLSALVVFWALFSLTLKLIYYKK